MCRRLFKIPTDLEILEMILSMRVLKFSLLSMVIPKYLCALKYEIAELL